jgi:hypothetical protein
MSLQLPTILSPPTLCTPASALTVSPQVRPRSCRIPSRVGFRLGLRHFLRMLANASGRIEFIIFLIMDWLFASGSLHPASRRRSCLQLRTASALSDRDFHPAVGAHSQAHGGTGSVPSHFLSSFFAGRGNKSDGAEAVPPYSCLRASTGFSVSNGRRGRQVARERFSCRTPSTKHSVI